MPKLNSGEGIITESPYTTPEAATLLDRIASAPISWGVCEVPGWGIQLSPERVLSEMKSLGISATELGSLGYLPTDASQLRTMLDEHGLRLTGGFVPLALHDPGAVVEITRAATESAALLGAVGADYFVTCAVSDPNNWARPELGPQEWNQLVKMLDLVGSIADDHGLVQAIHPHVNSIIETADEIQRVCEMSPAKWVLDTGHMAIGGCDPLRFAREFADKVAVTHLKDLRLPIARQLNDGHLTLMGAVQDGLFPPLGEGDIAITEVIRTLEAAGYNGWYVIEQDVAISGAEPAAGNGPMRDVEASVTYIRSIEFG